MAGLQMRHEDVNIELDPHLLSLFVDRQITAIASSPSGMDGDYISPSSYQLTTYLRIASVSIALYDFLETAPSTCISKTCKTYTNNQYLLSSHTIHGISNYPWSPRFLILSFCRGVFQIMHLGAWIYYVVAIIYDLTTSTICMVYLNKYKTASNSFDKNLFSDRMFYDGIGYFTALTCVNILNLVIYRASQDIQTAAGSTMKCLSRILYDVDHVQTPHHPFTCLSEISMKRRIDTAADAASSSTSQSISSVYSFKPKASTVSLDLTIPDFDLEDVELGTDWAEDGSAHVRVEKTVQVERRSRMVYELGDDSISPGPSLSRPR
ncbi:hypothetical protein F5877DRAFT_63736 [Lentinula edodes]|nr:hypothetical protein F5877DRAFT_63736 [Lentinula edodes]